VLRELLISPDPRAAAPTATLVVVAAHSRRDVVAARAAALAGAEVGRVLARREPSERPGSVVVVDLDSDSYPSLAWACAGDLPAHLRAAGAAVAGAVAKDAVVVLDDELPAWAGPAFAEGWLLGGYSFTLRSGEQKLKGSLTMPGAPADYEPVRALAEATATARDLANTPSNIKSPEWLAEQVRDACQAAGMTVTVMGPDELRRKGFGGVLAVGGGSARPPRLVVAERRGRRGAPTVALVGKGITFDSGGLSLKPATSMPLMKTDMAGAAAVTGALLASAAHPGASEGLRVVGVLPMAENMPAGSAYRPGDVITHFGGATTAVANTDAEGRLVLADALTYVRQRFRPDVVVDAATLTGAATSALSRLFGALFTDDEQLAEALLAAAADSGDRLWRLPLVAEYRASIESPLADIAQTATDRNTQAGAIVAALYLQHFAGDARWAHLDIAGPARAERASGDITVGATGYGVRLLTTWLQQGAAVAAA
jgi:leucyl aminopeptidase